MKSRFHLVADSRLRLARRLSVCAIALALAAAFVAADARAAANLGATARSSSQQIRLYSLAAKQQYVDNADDRTRGEGNNPFGNYSGTAAPAPTNEREFGPLAGDEGEYAFTLYTNSDHKTRAGTAIFICQYNFNKDGLCDAAFVLKAGTLIGKGSYNFAVHSFSLSIVGGTYKYRGAKGVVAISALGSSTQAQPVYRTVPMLQAQDLIFAIHSA